MDLDELVLSQAIGRLCVRILRTSSLLVVELYVSVGLVAKVGDVTKWSSDLISSVLI